MGSSSSKSEGYRGSHFTQVNPRPLATPNAPQRTATRRAPNYVYHVPRDDSPSTVSSAYTMARPAGDSSSSTVVRTATSSGSGASSSVSRTVNTPVTVTETSSVSNNPFRNNTTTLSYSRNSSSSLTSTVPTPENRSVPLVSSANSSNTSGVSSSFSKLDLNDNNSASSVKVGSTQRFSNHNINNSLGASNENVSSGIKGANGKNRYPRRRPNNTLQSASNLHFNSHRASGTSGNRQPNNLNQRPRSRNFNNLENEGNITNDDLEDRRPRNRNRENGNFEANPLNSGAVETKKIHDAFMKKLIGTFPPKYDKFRGMFCAACNHYEIFIGRRPNVKHIDTVRHKNNIKTNPRIKSLSCSTCKAFFQCDIQFLVAHKQSEIHMFISDQRPRVSRYDTKQNAFKEDNFLPLKSDIKLKFLQRLDSSSDVNDYSFYCHVCEEWFTDCTAWDQHLKGVHESDKEQLNMAFKHCQQCKLMMCGSRLLGDFHLDAIQHEKFRTFLNMSLEERDGDDEDSTRDDFSTTSSTAARDQNSERPTYLVLKNLPPCTSKRDVFNYFKDFGHLKSWEINVIGENTALLEFKFGNVAENIINSKFPLEINGARFDACIHYLDD